MTKEDFIKWLKFYLDKSAQDQIDTIREKLSLVNDVDLDSTPKYWSDQYPNKVVVDTNTFVSTYTSDVKNNNK